MRQILMRTHIPTWTANSLNSAIMREEVEYGSGDSREVRRPLWLWKLGGRLR